MRTHVVPDVGELGEVISLGDHRRERPGRATHGVDRVTVGANPEWIGALDLEEIRERVELPRDVEILHL